MSSILKQFWKEEEGATAVEYALIVGLIAVVLIGTLSTLGGTLDDLFGRITDKLEEVGAVTPAA